MSLTQAKQAVRAVLEQIVADHTAYPLVVETGNRDIIDQGTQTDPYLMVSVTLMSAEQMDMADKPRVKQTGQILVSAVVKGGSGEAAADALLDFAMPYFDLAVIGRIQCHAFEAVGGREIKGWWYANAIVDFYYVRLSA